MMRRLIQIIGAAIVFALLTALTQLGGLVFALSTAAAWGQGDSPGPACYSRP